VSRNRDVTVTLTAAQIESVLRETAGRSGITALLDGLSGRAELHGMLRTLLADQKVSRSTIRALLVLSAFPSDGTLREVTDLPAQLGLSQSTAHRYVRTWVRLGLLEQDPTTKQYRRTPATPQDPNA
jgi:IclR helix-turn-helix domain